MRLFSHKDEKSGPPPDEKAPPPPPPTYGESKRLSQTPQTEAGWGAQPGPSYSPSTIYAVLHLAKSDRIRLLGFPGTIVKPLDDTIRKVWVVGIQEAGPYDQISYEWKLKGRPWYGQGSEAVPARRLMCHLLNCLSTQGWHLACSVDLSKKGWDKDSLMFKLGPVQPRYFFSISFNESDKIRMIDPPNDQVQQAFIDVIRTWPLGVQREEMKEQGCYQLKLKGNPWWTSDGQQINHSRLLAARILSTMDQLGYELVGSVDMSASINSSDSNMSELDSWFFSSKNTRVNI